MDIRKSDIFILVGLVLGAAAAVDLVRNYNKPQVWGLSIGIVVFAYMVGLRRGIKRR